MRVHAVSVLMIGLLACNEAAIPVAPLDPAPPSAQLVLSSGDGQRGIAGEFLREPLTVRVVNERGAGLSRVDVNWSVTSGAGGFRSGSAILDRITTQTGAGGSAVVSFQPADTGVIMVRAAISNSLAAPVHFSIAVASPRLPNSAAHVLVPVGPLFDCYGGPSNDPSIFRVPSDSLAVGVTVEFEYAPYLHPVCYARIVSRSVPPGGSAFDSGLLYAGERIGFVLDAPGEWVFEDVQNGGIGIIRVR